MFTTYLFVKLIHVMAAITAVGANLTYGFLLNRAEKEPDHLYFMLTTIRWIDRRVANPCYILVLGTGLVMVWQADYTFSQLWIWLPLALFVVIAFLGIAVFSPVIKKQLHLVQSGKTNTDEYKYVRNKSNTLGVIVTLLVVVILILMILKPT